MLSQLRPFLLGFVVTGLLFLAANLIAAHFQSDCGLLAVFGWSGCADDIRRLGFPFLVWESGGFAYRNLFNPTALRLDVLIGLSLCVIGGLACQLYARRQKPTS